MLLATLPVALLLRKNSANANKMPIQAITKGCLKLNYFILRNSVTFL
ncbi:hypothetical protein CSC02_1495 [Enterobacter hormaechei subsp. hoffmannii]|nr:hypothetical protein CSC02_1495 [Enterobacter hormaechei subsp. hoffmannii]